MAMSPKTRILLILAIVFLVFGIYTLDVAAVSITADNISPIVLVAKNTTNITESTYNVSPTAKDVINNTGTMSGIVAWIKVLDELNIKDRLFTLLSIIVFSLLIILIYLLIKWVLKDEGFFIQPFIVGSCSESYSGEAISNLLVTEYQRICEIYKKMEPQDGRIEPHKDRIISNKLNILFPRIKPSSESPAFSMANIGVSGGPVTPITISMGQLLNVLKRICCHPTDIITGSIQEYGSMIYLVAWMGHSQIAAWEVKRSIDDQGHIKGENGLPGMVRELAFKLAIDTAENTKAKTWLGFKIYTDALEEYYQHKQIGDDMMLEGCRDRCLRAAKVEPEYEEPINLLYNLAVECLGRADYIKAKKLFLDTISFRSDAEAFFGLGTASYCLKEYTEAIDAFDKAIELDLEDAAMVWDSKGGALYYLGKYEEAIAACNKAIELDPNDAAAWTNKSAVLDSLGKYNEALDACNKAIELDSNDISAWINKGNILNNLGKYNEALDACNKAIELDPKNALAWVNKGIALDNLGKYEEALDIHNKAAKLDPKDVRPLVNMVGSLIGLCRYDEALNVSNKAIELDQKEALAWNNKGLALDKLGKHEEAISVYSKAIELDPVSVLILNNKSSSLNDLGRYEEALDACNKAIEINPRYILAWVNKGIALDNLGRHEEALDAYNKAIKLNPKNTVAAIIWSDRGESLNGLGRHEEALDAYNKAIKLNPKKTVAANIWSNKGESLNGLGRHEEALDAYNKAIELDPKKAMPWYCKGMILKMLHHDVEAESCFSKAKELGYTEDG